MRFSFEWLREFAPIAIDAQTLAARLSVSGFEVGACEPFHDSGSAGAPEDWVLDIDITANRPDALSHFGLAREIAALLDLPLTNPSFPLSEAAEPARDAARIVIEARDLCPRYIGRVVKGVRIGPSPAWMARRLRAIGLTPRNGVVDASNYALFELGQPLHAFDLRTLSGGGVSVRRARAGESLVTVADRETKQLEEGMLVIAELGTGAPAAIAGVMGGLATAISDATVDVLIESAWFDPRSVRRTARATGLHTDASHRFERGADSGMTRFAADRLAMLLAEVAGGTVLAGAIDPGFPPTADAPGDVPAGKPSARGATVRYTTVLRSDPVMLRPARAAGILGIPVAADDLSRTLGRLGIEAGPAGPEQAGSGTLACRIPSWRIDLYLEADLIEEHARLTGYDAIPRTLPSTSGARAPRSDEEFEERVRDRLAGLGYREIMSYAMIPAADDERFDAVPGLSEAGRATALTIGNPLSDRWTTLRRSLVPGLARALSYNLARNRSNLGLFEVGTVHALHGDRPFERRAAAVGASGQLTDPGWPGAQPPYDLLQLKGAIEDLVAGLCGTETAGRSSNRLAFAPLEQPAPASFQPGQAFAITFDGRPAGRGGRLSDEAARAIESERPLFVAEILLDPFASLDAEPRFRPLARLNPVERDLSFILDRTVPFARIEATIRGAADSLEHAAAGRPQVWLLDRFEGGPVPQGQVSYAIRFRFTQDERALTAEELNGAVEAVAEKMVSELGAGIRSRTADGP